MVSLSANLGGPQLTFLLHIIELVTLDSVVHADGAIMKKMKPPIQIEIHLHYTENAERSTVVIHRKSMSLKYRMRCTNICKTSL